MSVELSIILGCYARTFMDAMRPPGIRRHATGDSFPGAQHTIRPDPRPA